MNRFALVMAYYENPGMLRHHARKWLELPRDLLACVEIIVVDDGSPEHPAKHALEGATVGRLRRETAGFQVWRMAFDVPWNQDACRNVGVREARAPWLLLTDMDHEVPVDTWHSLLTKKLRKGCAFRFGRVNAPNLEPYKSHPNSWAMPRRHYWAIGGYDEALAGNYGTDGDFLVRARAAGEVVERPEVLVRYPREVIPDASTTTLERKNPAERARINTLVKGRAGIPDWKPLHFAFPCARVL